MTMRELAKLANVSVSTVSKAFHGGKDISAQTREHVFAVAKQYGCYGSFYQGKYPKKVIAVICPELAGDFYSGFVEKLQKLIEQDHCTPIISTDHFSHATQAELIEYYADYLCVDGILVFDLKAPVKKGYKSPIVSLYSADHSGADCVNIDIDAAIYDAVCLLQDRNHENIAFFGERLTTLKEASFRQAIRNVLHKEPIILTSEFRFEKAGKDCAEQLKQFPDVTAIVCAYDNIAFGAIKALQEQGLRIPEDISVIGIDNTAAGQYASTALTTIDANPDEVCLIAWELLKKKIHSSSYRSNQTISIRPTLIIRDSVAIRR